MDSIRACMMHLLLNGDLYCLMANAKLLNISAAVKGQLISNCPFGVIVWTKIPTKKFDNFCPRI